MMRVFLQFWTIFVFSLLGYGLYAQTGPGGVGNSDGSGGQPKLVMWLSADSLSLSDGDYVSTWRDLSGNGNDATQATGASQPQYLINQINGKPSVIFDGTDDFLLWDGSLIVNTNYTFIVVARRRSNSGRQIFTGGSASAGNQNLHFFVNSGTNLHSHHYSNDFDDVLISNAETYSSGTDVNEYGFFATMLNSSTPGREHFQNNLSLGSNTSGVQLSSYPGAALARYLPTNVYSEVDVSEVMVFASALNDAQLQIINEYLDLKYGLEIYNDLVTIPAAYAHNMAGIGEESNGEHSEASSSGLYLTALSGLNSGDYVFVSNDNAANNSGNFNTDAEVVAAGAVEAYNRIWYLNAEGSPSAQLAFDFSEALSDGLNPTNVSNYVLLFRSGTSGSFAQVKAADGLKNGDQVYFDLNDTQLLEGYYTLGTTNDEESPLEGVSGKTWYTLISGDWEDWEIWTLDPSGALPNNPDQLTPTTSATNTADNVVILTGRTVDVASNNLANAKLTVDGRLDLSTTSGHSFGEIRGTGRILMAADNFPSGDATHFSSEGQGEGTVEYYGGTYDLATAHEFFDVEIELDNSTDVLTLTADYNINGNLTITKGKLKINDDASTTILNLTVYGDVMVQSNGAIITGEGDTRAAYQIGAVMPEDDSKDYHSVFHQFTIYGDFTNYGTVRFTNLDAPDYDSFAADGAVVVWFKGASNNEVNLYNTTDFYHLIVEKGTSKTYKINLYSDNTTYFHLFGSNSVGRNQNAPYSAEDPQIRKALWVKSGTLQLRGNILIPTLSEGQDEGGNGDYAIGKNARFWLDGANVTVYSTASSVDQITGFTSADTYPADGIDTGGSNQAMSVFGEFKITDGYFGTRNSAGFIFWAAANAQLKIEGGECYVAQVRSSSSGSGVASYIQTGGTMTVFGNTPFASGYTSAFPLFGLETSDAVFQMSGGEIVLQDDGGDAGPEFKVISSEGNYNVTGGALKFELADGRTAQIQSTANLWNLISTNTSASGNFTLTMLDDLTVMGDLTLNNYTTLNAAGFDLNIGDDWEFQDGASFVHGNNTVSFVGNGSSYIYVRNTSTPDELVLNNLVLAKDQRYNPTLFHMVEVFSGSARNAADAPLLIEGDLTISRGEFDVNNWLVNLEGDIEIVDGLIDASATTAGHIVLNGAALQNLKGAYGKEQSFAHLELDNAAGAKLLSDINVTDFTLTTGIMDLDIYNLDVSGSISTSGTYGNTLMFETAGNASDGGLGLYLSLENRAYSTETVLEFPIGSAGVYNPTYVYIDGNPGEVSGTVAMNGADGIHPAATTGNALEYYWNVEVDGFSGINHAAVNYVFTFPSGFDAGWQCMKLLSGTTEWDKANDDSTPDAFFYDVGMYSGAFSVGNPSGFNNLTVYYSRTTNGNWSQKASWSKVEYGGAQANKTPEIYDIVKIGYEGSPGAYTRHRITLDVGSAGTPFEIAELILEQNPEAGADENLMSRLIIPPTRGLKVNGKISGDGEIQFQMDGANVPTLEGDFGDFVNTEGASFIMRSNNGNVIAPTNITRFPRLSIPGASNDWDNSRSVTFTTDIYCHNLNVRYGGTLLLNDGASGDVEVRDSLRIGGIGTDNEGRIIYQNTGAERTITVGGNLILDTDGSTYDNNQLYVETGGTANLEHRLVISGDIVLRNPNSYIDLFTANDGSQSNVILELVGESNASFSDVEETVPEFYRIKMNKLPGKDFDFQDDFTLNGPTDGDDKALELISGRLMLSDADIDLTLTSGGADFKIPAEATLYTGQSSTVRITGNNTGIWLDGQIHAGWDTKWYLNGGTNNYIEYTSSGNSEIDIFQAEFYVGSHIRRSSVTEEGILDFGLNHASSTVVIGTNAHLGGEADRGVFELLNAGSRFYQITGSTLIVANGVPSASVPSFYLDLDAASVDIEDGSVIQLGGSQTSTSQTIGLYSSQPLKTVKTNNASTNEPSIMLYTSALSLNDLEIVSGTSFNANGLDLNVYGDFTSNGTFVSNQNNMYFLGTTDQQIVGSPVFYNLHKTTTNTLTLSNDVDVDNELHLEAGTLNDGDNTLTVQGNVWMDLTHIWGGTSDGIKLNGTSEQTLRGSGTFGKLSIQNSFGVSLPAGNAFTINNALQLGGGIFDIDRNLLILNENATVIEAAAFSEANMIQTNISFTDAGVKKFFPEILPEDSYSFVYPIGSEGKYTPVEFDIDSLDAGGWIRVKAANEIHPTIANDTEPCNEIVDTANVLKYHWTLESDGVTGFTADARMKYYADDYQENSAFYDVTNYIAARLLAGSILWNKYDQDSFDEGNQELKFSFASTNDDGVTGDYTAGVESPGSTCKGAIPDEVPSYITTGNGSWTDASIWDTYPVSGGTVPAGGPRGAIAIVEHEVEITKNYIVNYKTQINASGIVKVGSTFGHRLGIVEGTGTLQMERGNLPAGVYDDFFGRNGGTIEFTGSDDYDVLSEITTVRNLKFSGTGERRLPNLDFEVYGVFTIAGDDATLEVVNEHDRIIKVDSNLVFTQGSFDAGIGNSKLVFNGTSLQTVTGNFTSGNSFWNVEVKNASGVSLSGDMEVKNNLIFTSGIVYATATEELIVNNSSETALSGYSSSKFVEGPLKKLINSGDDFYFPVGDDGRYGPIQVTSANADAQSYWDAEYKAEGYNSTTIIGSITRVSEDEYWRINVPTGGADFGLTLYWNESSTVPNDLVNPTSDLKLAKWNGSAWELLSGTFTVNTTAKSISPNTNPDLLAGDHYFAFCTDGSLPDPAGPITGDALVCRAENGVSYSVGAISGATSYVWTMPDGASIATGDGTNSITVDFDNSFESGTIEVQGKNNIGEGIPSSIDVEITPIPVISPTDVDVCSNGTVTYSTANNGNTYTWTISGGVVTVDNGNSVDVTWGTSLGAGRVIVEEFDGVCSNKDTLDVNIISCNNAPVLNAIGDQTVCGGGDLLVSISASDVDGDGLTFSLDATSSAAGMYLTVTGLTTVDLKWDAIANPAVVSENHTVTITVTDNGSPVLSDFETFTLIVTRTPETGNVYTRPNE